jgi:hypothetical protein
LKRKFVIILVIFHIILLGITSLIFFLKKSPGNDNGIPNFNNRVDTSNITLINNNQEVKLPEYVPPKDGGDNSFWCGNRHRYILKDRKCYFGNGLKRGYCGGQNWQCKDSN